MQVEIRPYTREDWSALHNFIAAYWSPAHPILSRELFDWQYRGFIDNEPAEHNPPALLLRYRDALIGFIGLIHGHYQLNVPHAVTERGCAIAMWMMHPDYRHVGLGPLLLREVESRARVAVCLGVNTEAGFIYRQRGYHHLHALDRWVAPLDGDGYATLCAEPGDLHELRDWAARTREPAPLNPQPIDANALASLWQTCTRTNGRWAIQGLARSAAFYRVRYEQSVGFDYHMWRESPTGPAIVGRVESVFDHPHRVLRLIELLPGTSAGWSDRADAGLAQLVGRVLAWGAAEGCVAADFQISEGLLASTLRDTPFRAQPQPPHQEPLTSLAPVFQPLSFTKPPINAYWRVATECGSQPWCFPKSDGDMDRPHALR